MLMTRFVVGMLSVGLMVLGAGVVSGQVYPNKPIRIMTSQPGGIVDFVARLVAPGIGDSLGQSMIVDNRSGNLPAEAVAKAPPDGYTLLFVGGAFSIVPFLRKTSYDPVRDFSPITLATISPNILVVHPSLPVKSVKELIALAKARPGELNLAIGGVAGISHLAGELFKAMLGINLVGVPYKGSAPAVNAVIGGE